MPIYDPEIHEPETARELLKLISSLFAEKDGVSDHNQSSDLLSLSPKQQQRLIVLCNEFGRLPEFRKAAFFVAGVSGDSIEQERLREMYLSERARRGRSRMASTSQWADFVTRMGLVNRWDRYFGIQGTKPMGYSHFREMEQRLLNIRHLSPKLRRQMLAQIDEQQNNLDRINSGRLRVSDDDIMSLPEKIENDAKDHHIKKRRLSAFATVISDVGVLFTTRDWSVAGTLSTMVGAASLLSSPA